MVFDWGMKWKEDFLDYLRYERNYSPQTEIAYYTDLTQFEAFITQKCGSFDPTAIDGDLIRIWMVHLMEQQVKARSANRKLSAVKSFFRYLKKKKIIAHNPAQGLSGPKAERRLPAFVDESRISRVIDDETQYSDDFEGHRDRFMMELLYLTGMRRAELIALKDADIDFNNATLRVTGKRNKQRLIPFSAETAEKLKAYIKERDASIKNKTAFLFVKENGAPLYPKLVYNVVHRHLESIPTLSRKSPHILRHSFATEMLNNGAEINAVKELLGHSSLASTEVYTHVTFEEMKKAYHNAHPRAKK